MPADGPLAGRAHNERMSLRGALIASLAFTSLTLVPAGAHLMSLASKIVMSAPDYLAAQKAYTGWNLSAVLVIGALVSTATLVWQARGHERVFMPALIALGCVIAAQVVFWTLNFPANQQTSNWTRLPDQWQSLRQRWEIGHALAALLNLGALATLLTANFRILRTN